MSRIEKLTERKARLIAKAAEQRATIAGAAVGLAGPLAWADRGLDAVAYLKARPWLAAGLGAGLLALRPRRALRLARLAFRLWRGTGALRMLLAAIQARRKRPA
jgi:hypothetical protein